MTVQLAQANSIRIPLADESVHCCITSPPFFGLRNYGLPPVVWGGDSDCKHVWGKWREDHDVHEETKHGKTRTTDRFYGDESRRFDGNHQKHTAGQFCQHCHAWRGCLGLEPTPDLYVAHLVEVFREVRRVLRSDGVVWLNLGASYAGSQQQGGDGSKSTLTKGGKPHAAYPGTLHNGKRYTPGFKPKDLIPVPWLVALALQRDGWWLRSAPPWLKRNCLPESVRDRPTTAHEYWFLLSKSARYFYDVEAVRMPNSPTTGRWGKYPGTKTTEAQAVIGGNHGSSSGIAHEMPKEEYERRYYQSGRNRRTTDFFFESLDALIADQRRYLRHLERVRDNGGMLLDEDGEPLALVFNTKGYAGAHYATFNPDMIEPLVKSSTSERGVCPRCKSPWERVVDRNNPRLTKEYHAIDTTPKMLKGNGIRNDYGTNNTGLGKPGWRKFPKATSSTTGWQPTCDCAETYVCEQCNGSGDDGHSGHCLVCDGQGEVLLPPDPAPAVILDPFVGSGTVPVVARKLGRHGVGFDLSFDYLRDQARVRLELDAWHDWHDGGRQAQAAWEELPLFAAQEAV